MGASTDSLTTEGSPAGAGIDPSPPAQPMRCGWFPRRRGDRPMTEHLATIITAVPPQARG